MAEVKQINRITKAQRQEFYIYAVGLMHTGASYETIRKSLMERGADVTTAVGIINDLRTGVSELKSVDPNAEDKIHKARRQVARGSGFSTMISGLVIAIIGIAITVLSYQAARKNGGGVYIITFGLIIGGAAQFIRGLSQLL